MPVLRVNNDGVRCARSSVFGVSTIATLIEPPRFAPALAPPPPKQPAGITAAIVSRAAIKARRTVAPAEASAGLSCARVATSPTSPTTEQRLAGSQARPLRQRLKATVLALNVDTHLHSRDLVSIIRCQ